MFLLDLDGTIYWDSELIDGTLEMLDYIKLIGANYIFLTNNSSKNVSQYVGKLEKMGVFATENEFVTSTDATIIYLKA